MVAARPETPSPASPQTRPLAVGIAGLGAIGGAVAERLDQGIEGLELVAIAARDGSKARGRMAAFRHPVPLLDFTALAEACAVVVECAPAAVFMDIAEAAIAAGRILMPLSVGVLLEHPELIAAAERSGARIIVPTGALLGLDAVRAAAVGEIRSVKLVTRKPPAGLAGAPYLSQHGISLEGLTAPLKVFDGSAGDGAKGFPANVNVGAALSLAGIGAERTRLEIWADPGIDRNIQHVEVEADSARITMTIENVPSDENPRTGRITALSVIAALSGLVDPLKIGS